MLFGRQGPLWYRGMVQDEEKYDFVDEEIVKSILDHYSVKKIIVGHTELDKTTYFHGENVIDINISAKTLKLAGIVIE